MPKNLLTLLILTTILITAFATVAINTGLSKPLSQSEIDRAVNQASQIYKDEKARNRDLSGGPCLSDALMPGWVFDIVHNPRLSIDDLPQNQCPSYREDKTKHIVELDTEGNLIKAK